MYESTSYLVNFFLVRKSSNPESDHFNFFLDRIGNGEIVVSVFCRTSECELYCFSSVFE